MVWTVIMWVLLILLCLNNIYFDKEVRQSIFYNYLSELSRLAISVLFYLKVILGVEILQNAKFMVELLNT